MKENKKIVPFDITRMDPEDLETDRFLRESVKEEADELEKRLNSDPSLIGVGASDDLFDAIVGKLKEQGLWEEEENKTDESEVSDVKSEEKLEEESARIAPETESIPKSDVERLQELSASGVDRVEKCAKNGSGCGKASGSEQIEDSRKVSDSEKALDSGKSFDSGKASDSGEASDRGKAEEDHRILSEEEEALLELGRQTLKQKEKRAIRRKKWGHVLKRCGAVASVVIIIGGIGMTSEANRKVVMKAWDAVRENLRFRVSTDYVDTNDSVYSELVGEEKEAIEDISDKLGIMAPYFLYKPEGMTFLEYEIRPDDSNAVMIYMYEGKLFTVDMSGKQIEYNNYYSADDEETLIDSYDIVEAKVEIRHASVETEPNAYIVEVRKQDSRYILNGVMPVEEIKKMIEYCIFL